MKILKKPSFWLVAVLFIACCSQTPPKREKHARNWARTLHGVSHVECVSTVGGCESDIDGDNLCTVYREDADPITLTCNENGCWRSK